MKKIWRCLRNNFGHIFVLPYIVLPHKHIKNIHSALQTHPPILYSLSLSAGTSVFQVTATDADDPTYGNSARVVYSVLHGQPYFSVDPKTGKFKTSVHNVREGELTQSAFIAWRFRAAGAFCRVDVQLKSTHKKCALPFYMRCVVLDCLFIRKQLWATQYTTSTFYCAEIELDMHAVLFGSWLYNGEHPWRMRWREHCVKAFRDKDKTSGERKRFRVLWDGFGVH